jgi:hypothetical protein
MRDRKGHELITRMLDVEESGMPSFDFFASLSCDELMELAGELQRRRSTAGSIVHRRSAAHVARERACRSDGKAPAPSTARE